MERKYKTQLNILITCFFWLFLINPLTKNIFGTKFGGSPPLSSDALVVVKFQVVDHYGLQFFWSDGHKDGIYTYSLLKRL